MSKPLGRKKRDQKIDEQGKGQRATKKKIEHLCPL